MANIEQKLIELNFWTESSNDTAIKEYCYDIVADKINHSLCIGVMIENESITQVWLESKSQSFTLHTVKTIEQIEGLIAAL